MTAGGNTPDSIASLRTRGRRSSRRSSPLASEPSLQNDLFAFLQDEAEEEIAVEVTPVSIPERRIWSVAALVNQIRQRVEREHPDLWVEGEISNCRPAPSGHIYLTLKDGEAQLPVVLFRRQAHLLRFRPADGMAVLVRGRVSIYESRGQLQLIAETMEPRGAGALQIAFEQLKERLLAEGLFDEERKRPLPAFPRCVGIITSPHGAVLRDIATVVQRRHARLNLLVYPATMQGANCAASVIEGLRWFNRHPERADLILIARGGGSLEDLAGFNDEALAREIAASELSVVSAVGHETDFTIADFVADLRAPTPSAAAELITAAQHQIEDRLEELQRRLQRAARYHLLMARQRYAQLSAGSILLRMQDAVNRREQRVEELRLRLDFAAQHHLRRASEQRRALAERLRLQDPGQRLAAARQQVGAAQQRLHRLGEWLIAPRHAQWERASARLAALSPLAVLERGYALVYTVEEDGSTRLLRDAQQVQPGQHLRARLARGEIAAQVVERTREEKE